MGATYRKRGKRSWPVTVHSQGERQFKTVRSEADAKALVQYITTATCSPSGTSRPWRAWTATWGELGRPGPDAVSWRGPSSVARLLAVSKPKVVVPRSAKHRHGSPNPILLAEENALLATVDRALASSNNAQVIGRNGELPLRQFFNRYLPFTLRAATGHFVTPRGQLSSQIDLVILDTRYPLLAENQDGTVLAMLHAVLATYEVKTNMTTRDVIKGWDNARGVMALAGEVKAYGHLYRGGWSAVRTDAIAYRIAQRLETTETAYIRAATPATTGFDVHVLRLPPQDQTAGGTLGGDLHMEPMNDGSYLPIARLSQTMLSDVYYRLVQDSYYTLAHRNWTYADIGRHFNDYMAWSTLSWDDYGAMMRAQPRKRTAKPGAPRRTHAREHERAGRRPARVHGQIRPGDRAVDWYIAE